MSPEELLLQMTALQEDTTDYCTIDPETRTISVPPKYQLLGVESDEKVKRIWFQCPKIVDDNVDLSKLGIRVNYQNANGTILPYVVSDAKTEGDNVIFSWLLDRSVTAYKGNVRFIVCATKASGDSITNEWNTTLATSQVLEGLEPDTELSEDETDIVKQLIAIATQRLTDVQLATGDAIEATNNAKTATQEAVNATEDARSVIEQITKDSYLHTVLETFINEVTAKPTAYGNALVEKIEGYIRQTATKGNQLFDANTFPTYSIGGATLTFNGDGSFTVSGSGSLSQAYIYTKTYEHEETVKMLKAGKLNLFCGAATNPKFQAILQTNSGNKVYLQNDSSGVVSSDVLENDLNDSSSVLIIRFYGESGSNIVPGTIKPMLYQDGDGTWEPYTGGEPAPSPDYPQTIHGVGDMGFFDGELIVGSYSDSTGALVPQNNNYVSSVNFIPCKANDSINLIYETQFRAAWILFYKKDGTFISSESALSSQNITVKAPSDSYYFRFSISESSAVANVSSAKHITVTINGMYAICVKSVGKNLIDFDNYYGSCGANGEYSGTATDFNEIRINIPRKYIGMTLTLSAMLKISGTLTGAYVAYIRNNIAFFGNKIENANEYEKSKVSFLVQEGDKILLSYGSNGSNTLYVKNIQLEIGESATNYVPYQGKTTYIPISSPLFEGDQIIKRNGEYKVYRKKWYERFDGTLPWRKNDPSNESDYIYYKENDPKKKWNGRLFCNRLTQLSNSLEQKIGVFMNGAYPKALYVKLSQNELPTNNEYSFNKWLESNPIYVAYELATPIEEELTPEAQKAIHSIMACDEQTTIEIVGVPTDAEVQNQFLLPRNVDGALNTTAFATSKRNEITLEEQQTAAEARLQAIEAQILKEV